MKRVVLLLMSFEVSLKKTSFSPRHRYWGLLWAALMAGELFIVLVASSLGMPKLGILSQSACLFMLRGGYWFAILGLLTGFHPARMQRLLKKLRLWPFGRRWRKRREILISLSIPLGILLLGLSLQLWLTLRLAQPQSDEGDVFSLLLSPLLSQTGHWLFWLVALGVVVPVLEEALFRGALQPWLASRFGRVFGLYGTALIFTAFHTQYWKTPLAWLAIFAVGVITGSLRQRYTSCWPGIWAHSAYNLTALLVLYWRSSLSGL